MGVTEGVSFVGCSGPMVYTPAIIGSVIFEWLRSSKYTPSVSHSLDSSLREGAGERPHSTGRSETPGLRAIFIAPTKGRFPFIAAVGEKRGRCGCTDPAGCVREG